MGSTEEAPSGSANPIGGNKTKSDFLFLEELGEGSYSTVYLGSEKETHTRFAIKVCSKAQILREKKITQIFREKECLTLLSTKENYHKLVIRLYCTFQDTESLYFVLSLASRRDLLAVLKKKKKLSIEEARFASAEIAVALGHIHKLGVLHRDVKPENVLLSETGHMILSDFGCAKKIGESDSQNPPESTGEASRRVRRTSFVGTAHYVSPEVLQNKPADETCDYWALGCIFYQCLFGDRPFNDVSEYFIFKRIIAGKYEFPEDFSNPEAKDLIQKLFILETEDRLGSKKTGGAKAIMDHSFFAGVEWSELPEIPSPLL
ncbi:hypothetical protein FO519_003674 [Halicephalobus sp. NKZ332]|nr:hypothetical protein FO519_003674 [Halicephalobus sp. NKZ332]